MHQHNGLEEETKEYKTIRHILQDIYLPTEEREFLCHILNITRRGERCGYYGRFRNEGGIDFSDGTTNAHDRCLAVELNNKKSVSCPFYDKTKEDKCTYRRNSKV